jgi:SulP family sulfate permease
MLSALGLLRLGRFVKYIPYPVTLGFTAGIGSIIFASQLAPFLGLVLAGPEPGPLLDKLPALWEVRATVTWPAVALGLATIALIRVMAHFAPRLPGMLNAIGLAALATWAFGLPIETIGSRFGGLRPGLTLPHLPPIDLHLARDVLPDALAFTLLGAIESLLSAVVADSLSGRRHRPDTELIAQGLANITSSLFGGLPVTGTIARTATNVRAGARSPIAGIIHSLTLLAFTLTLAPLAAWIPLCALAGVLISVALHMIDGGGLWRFARSNPAESAVMAVTLALTLFRTLSLAIAVGTALGAILIVQRLAQMTRLGSADLAETPTEASGQRVTLRITGAFFFGSASIFEQALDRIGPEPKEVILDLAAVPLLDASGAQSLARIAKHARDRGAQVTVAGAAPGLRKTLAHVGLH